MGGISAVSARSDRR